MIRKTNRNTAALVAALAFFGVAACGGDGGDGPGGSAAVTEMPFDVATAGSVQGMVMYEGAVPAPETIDMASERACAEQHGGPATREVARVSNGHLAEVFVYVKEGLEGMAFPVPGEAVVIDQEGCLYVPRVVGAMTNQTITLRNSDGLLHNINATPQVNRGFNISQPVNMDTNRTFPQPEVMIPLRCDVHGWMGAYVGVLPHPYHAVTGDQGTFSLDQLPPGEYLIEAWHPRLGTQEQRITVTTGETTSVSFTYTEAMLASAVVPLGPAVDPHDHGPLERVTSGVGVQGHAAPGSAAGPH